MKALNFKPIGRGSLSGAFDLELPSGMIVRSCSLFEKDGKRWVSGPSKKIGTGETAKYERLVEFTSRDIAEKFNVAALAALGDHLGGSCR
jgi:hypothetical protein